MKKHISGIRILIVANCAISVMSIGIALYSLRLALDSDKVWLRERKRMQTEIATHKAETLAFAEAVYARVSKREVAYEKKN